MIFKKSNLKKNISTIQASDINSGKQANHKDDKRPWYVVMKKTLDISHEKYWRIFGVLKN